MEPTLVVMGNVPVSSMVLVDVAEAMSNVTYGALSCHLLGDTREVLEGDLGARVVPQILDEVLQPVGVGQDRNAVNLKVGATGQVEVDVGGNLGVGEPSGLGGARRDAQRVLTDPVDAGVGVRGELNPGAGCRAVR